MTEPPDSKSTPQTHDSSDRSTANGPSEASSADDPDRPGTNEETSDPGPSSADADDTPDADDPTSTEAAQSPVDDADGAPTADRTSDDAEDASASQATDDAEDAPASEATDDGGDSMAASAVVYAARLTGAFLVVVGQFLLAGGRFGWNRLVDSSSRERTRRWILLEGDRRAIVGGFVLGVFAIALGLGVSDVIGVRESRFVTTMFSTMIAGLFSFIPIVVSVNQLIVSRLFGTPDRLTDRIDGVQEFRARVEGQTAGDGVSPTEPAPFLARLAGTLGERADSLAEYCERAAEGDLEDAESDGRPSALETVCRFASRTGEHADTLSERLTGETGSMFAVVLPTMDHDYAASATEARRLSERFDEDLSDRARGALAELRELYVTADATRQYFTTMYLQQELARLSRLITYSGTAALLLSTLVIMIYASGYPPVAHEGPLLVLVSIALAVAFSPLAVLFAYVVRIATILKRTSAPGAFTPPGERHDGDG